MTSALLDTSVLIALVTPDEVPPELDDIEDTRVSSLSWVEITVGLHTVNDLPRFRRRQAASDVLRRTLGAGIPFDDGCEAAYAAILDRVSARGGSPKAHVFDRMIAATAAAHRLPLITRNAADLRGLEGIVELLER
ncbi:PIN domain-containing protein [Microbacterium sp. KR10-403]|uniref:PIN domain-containing protein n=1 Tax=Microbacterium sp. KR10-403 TaxID=3158581 RepID=UPI0032E4048E